MEQGIWLVGDVNGDGKDDIVHRWDLGINTWISNGNGTYTITSQSLPPDYGVGQGVWLGGDTSGDGKPLTNGVVSTDIFVSSYTTDIFVSSYKCEVKGN